MTDDPRTEARRNALRELKRRRHLPWFAALGLIFFLVNLVTAMAAGRVYAAWPPHLAIISHQGRSSPIRAMTIPYKDDPTSFIWVLSISIVAVPFFGGLLYSYFLKTIPD